MRKLIALLIATVGLGFSYASADEAKSTPIQQDNAEFKIMLNSCDSRWFRQGEDCISYTGQCPEMYFPGQSNCSQPDYDDDYDEGYEDGSGEGFGRIMNLEPQHWGRSRRGCYQVCEYIYKG